MMPKGGSYIYKVLYPMESGPKTANVISTSLVILVEREDRRPLAVLYQKNKLQ
jgi:hypothetical protein